MSYRILFSSSGHISRRISPISSAFHLFIPSCARHPQFGELPSIPCQCLIDRSPYLANCAAPPSPRAISVFCPFLSAVFLLISTSYPKDPGKQSLVDLPYCSKHQKASVLIYSTTPHSHPAPAPLLASASSSRTSSPTVSLPAHSS